MAYAAFGLLACALLYLLARAFVAMPARDVAHAFKTFGTAFAALAGTGLLFTGRFGLAIVTLGATAMAARALWRGPLGADRMSGKGGSSVETDLLAMRLDHATGEVDGRVKRGRAAGRELSSLGQTALTDLLEDARRDDPPSVPLLEAYLDRRFPDWRFHQGEAEAAHATGTAAMDERTALDILGLAAGASAAEIKAAHRQLMARLHPDHGGSSYLAAQLNQARDHLLGRKG